MALIDYANRKYDYLALRNVQPIGEAQLQLELFNEKDSGQIAVGVQKLAQRWLLEFLTDRGSMPGLPTRGTNFMRSVTSGNARNASDLRVLFDLAVFDAGVNLRDEEDDTWPADERFSGAALVGVSFTPGYANLRITVVSAAGASRGIILPISTLPQNIG
jgi:hypothetical protein